MRLLCTVYISLIPNIYLHTLHLKNPFNIPPTAHFSISPHIYLKILNVENPPSYTYTAHFSLTTPHIPRDPSSQKSPLLYLHTLDLKHSFTTCISLISHTAYLSLIPRIYLNNLRLMNSPHIPTTTTIITTTTTTTSFICTTINTYSVAQKFLLTKTKAKNSNGYHDYIIML